MFLKEKAQILFVRMNAADGSKLKKTVTDGSTNKTVDYLGGFQYRNALLDFFPTTSTSLSAGFEGYVRSVPIGIGGNPHYSFHYVYNYTDHLGNIRLKYTKHPQTGTIQILERINYYPFGLEHRGYEDEHEIIAQEETGGDVTIIRVTKDLGDPYKYKFGGKELQKEFGIEMYDFGARNYDAAIGRWMNVDPLADETLQAYSAFNNNPLYYNDPTGMIGESVGVKDLGEGKYEVVSGNVDDGDKGVYIVDSNGSYDINSSEKIGNTITTHSFFDDNENVVEGAVIDMNSNEGQEFLDQLMEDNPSRLGYMWNARNGKKYDFKEKGIKERGSLTRNQHRNRGSVNSNGEIGSARDYGNIGAGMVAARKGLSWGAARSGFDLYQGYKSNGVTLLSMPGAIRGTRSISVPTILPEREATTSVKAQMTGFLMGLQKIR